MIDCTLASMFDVESLFSIVMNTLARHIQDEVPYCLLFAMMFYLVNIDQRRDYFLCGKAEASVKTLGPCLAVELAQELS